MGKWILLFSLGAIVVCGFFLFKNSDLAFNFLGSKVIGTSTKRVKPQIANNWFPKLDTYKANSGPYELNVNAKAAILVNFDDGEVIYAKDAKAHLPAGSTIKIMTALVALENAKLNDTFAVSEKAAKIGEDSMNLSQGEQLSLNELLYGLMLVSGNDAAITMAEGISGSEDAYVALMNEKARFLGAGDTFFVNASGLDEDNRKQYSSAYDLATIARYIWENYSDFRKIASTEHVEIEANDRHKNFDLSNQTNLLTSYPGVRGIKPGFTWEAGLCLVTYGENNGKKLLGVILGSDDRRGEMKELLDFGFAKYGIKVEHPGLDL